MTRSSKAMIGFVLSSLAALSAGCSGDGLASGQTACSYGGKTYSSGSIIPANDGCNTCLCDISGVVECTLMACLGDAGFSSPAPDASSATCALSTAVSFGYDGGMVAYQDQDNLAPSTGLTITRNYVRGVTDGSTARSCAPALPACGTPSVVSVLTIVADLAAADVQSAFALTSTPIFGVDSRPVDGAIWSITLASGGTILVGSPCPSPVMNSCRPIPAGVQKLSDDLKSLAGAAAAQAVCAGL